MLQLHHKAVHHTCMLRESQTSTQAFFKFIITQLAWLLYHYLHISKQLSSIKLIIASNSLPMLVFIIPNLDAYHSRTNFFNHSKYHSILKYSQNNISEACETSSFFKIKPPPCSKRYKWSTRAKTIKLKRYKWST